MFASSSAACLLLAGLQGCSPPQKRPLRTVNTDQHVIQAPKLSEANAAIPAMVNSAPLPPKPSSPLKVETYSVVVNNVEAADLLFALARDAKLNIDIHPGITGTVTLNAIDQTLPQLLNRISKQIDMRYEIEGKQLTILPDTPYLKHYRIDYVNITRESRSTSTIATQVSSSGGTPASTGASTTVSGGASSNNSTTQVTTSTTNNFWDTLVTNVRELLRETDKILPEGSSETTTETARQEATTGTGAAAGAARVAPRTPPTNLAGSPNPAARSDNQTTTVRRVTFREAAAVIAHPETGVISVRATSRQHEKVQEFLDQVMLAAKRQVLIEATVVEVQLSDQYQQGINWQRLRTDGTGLALTMQPQGSNNFASGLQPNSGPGGLIFGGSTTAGVSGGIYGAGLPTPGLFALRYTNTDARFFGNIAGAISLLESFGNVRVLSSPKISVLNNQTAMLKVVNNKVYFTTSVNVTPGTATTAPLVVYTSTPNTVPVGFLMSVTPQIEASGQVSINVRPTISRITGYVNDPSPPLAQAGVVSRIPEIETREMESVIRVSDGDIAVMGGLMQDSINDQDDSVPGLGSIPYVGNLFKYRSNTAVKSELVIFLRPIVIRQASLEGDYASLQSLQPEADFFTRPRRSSTDPR
ncbi:pilus (MSHA type) biogenesis protein MshL [Parvibium lacunae]|uniref:Pilus (MSHA type) biogenesis protein MshL n=1 Tax=Parvibium lacunae TaxID=1888893 RepID=A0A368KYT2_9BURK|nr:pilus (MSHA type) biogenesis protein MshL [Parvibium lacunae]RCS56570.1 pilus (MSHA type) biogenesis protein MshL [Parvibium lacunae]